MADENSLGWGVANSVATNIAGDELSVEVVDRDGFPIAEFPVEPILNGWSQRYPEMHHWGDGAEDGRTVRRRTASELMQWVRYLIAAPDLLDAAETALAVLEDTLGADCVDGCDCVLHDLRAAIALTKTPEAVA